MGVPAFNLLLVSVGLNMGMRRGQTREKPDMLGCFYRGCSRWLALAALMSRGLILVEAYPGMLGLEAAGPFDDPWSVPGWRSVLVALEYLLTRAAVKFSAFQ